jgi:hypothetical protein
MINLNINNIEDDNHSDIITCWNFFGQRPNTFILQGDIYDYSLFLNKFDIEPFNTKTEIINTGNNIVLENSKNLLKINNDIFMSFVVIDGEFDSKVISDIYFYYKNNKNIDDVYKIINDISEFKLSEYGENSSLNLISLKNSSLFTFPISLEIDEDNFSKYYSKKTMNGIINTIKAINKNKVGISILHGDIGTGKTHSIKKICKSLNKSSFFIPNNMIDQTLLNPDFINFIIPNGDSILIIDDFELTIDNYGRYNSIISSLTQITDSLISDIVNINFILVINDSNIKDILEDLGYKKIINIVSFDELTKDEANELAKYLGKKAKFTDSVKLVDIVKNNNIDFYNKRFGF